MKSSTTMTGVKVEEHYDEEYEDWLLDSSDNLGCDRCPAKLMQKSLLVRHLLLLDRDAHGENLVVKRKQKKQRTRFETNIQCHFVEVSSIFQACQSIKAFEPYVSV